MLSQFFKFKKIDTPPSVNNDSLRTLFSCCNAVMINYIKMLFFPFLSFKIKTLTVVVPLDLSKQRCGSMPKSVEAEVGF